MGACHTFDDDLRSNDAIGSAEYFAAWRMGRTRGPGSVDPFGPKAQIGVESFEYSLCVGLLVWLIHLDGIIDVVAI